MHAVHGRAARTVRDDQLRHVDRPGHLGLFVGELQHRDVLQGVAVEVPVQPQRTGFRNTHDPVAVQQHAPSLRDPADVDLPAQERRDVHPLDAVEAELVLVPRIADDVDRHRPHAVAVVGERERRRLRADHQVERELERLQPAREVDCVPLAALRDEPRVDSERAQRAGRVPGRAADARRAAGDHVTRELSDDGERHRRPI